MLAPHLTEETGPQADASRRALPSRRAAPGGEHGTDNSQEAAWTSLCTRKGPSAWVSGPYGRALGTDILGLDPGSATTACGAAPEA